MSEATATGFPTDRSAADNTASLKLSGYERFGYGIGDFGINLYFMSAMTFLLYFYTDVLGLTPGQAAGVMLVARLVDAVTDPLMGMLAERTRSRFGRMRPWIFAGAVPLGVIAILTFTVPDLDARGRLIWAYVTYIAFGIAYTVVSIPYSTMTAVLTTDHHERTLLSTVRMGCAFAGGFVVSVLMLKLVGYFGTEAGGFQGVMIGFAVIATGCLWLTAASSTERIAPPPHQRLTVDDSLRAVFLNPPLLVVMVLFTCGMLAFTIRQTIAVYYFEYNLGRPDLIGTFFMVTLSVMLVGLLGVPRLAARFGKGGSIVGGALLTIAGCIGLYFTPYDAPYLAIFWGCVVALGGTPIAVLGWAMIPDTIEYAQWRHGMRADGAVYSFSSFFQKLAKSVGGAGVAGVLSIAGYVANQAQSDASLDAIRAMMSWGPAAIMVLAIVAALLYPLNRDKHAAMVREIEARERSSAQK